METPYKPGKRQRAPSIDGSEIVDDNAIAATVLKFVGSAGLEPRPSKRTRTGASSSLFVGSLPAAATDESLAVFFSQHYPVKHATVVTDPKTKASRRYGFVTLCDPEDAASAVEGLGNTKWEGSRLKVEIAQPRERRDGKSAVDGVIVGKGSRSSKPKSPRLIVRNLPWSIKTDDQLAALFRPYGKVKFADLPQSEGKLSGFGFVTLRGKTKAQKAVDGLNETVVDGRTIIVDWAVEKDVWLGRKDGQDSAQAEDPEDDSDSEAGQDSDADDGAGASRSVDAKQGGSLQADLASFMQNHMQHLEDEDGDEDEDEDKDEGDEQDDAADKTKDDGGGSVVDGSVDIKSGSPSSGPEKPLSTSNVSTVFVRNLPFTATEEELQTMFSRFGKVRYARLVLDRTTERPTGSGFVCFSKEEDAKACIKHSPQIKTYAQLLGKRSVLQDERADQEKRYTMDGRVLSIVQALDKDEVDLVKSKRDSKQKEDKRRLYLLSEGTVDTRSTLYRLLSPSEIKMREESLVQRKRLVQSNPSLHVSLTRLAVRNIPHDVKSKTLKELARKAVVEFATEVKAKLRQPINKEEMNRANKQGKVKDRERKLKGKGIVKQSKVVYETRTGSKTADEAGGGRSRGYGFIEYHSHRWALMGLRWLNGHELKTADGKKQRLMVEFALENAEVVARRLENESKAVAAKSKHKNRQRASDPRWNADLPEASGQGAGKAAPAANQGRSTDQSIIARKRLMRKKKAVSRRANK